MLRYEDDEGTCAEEQGGPQYTRPYQAEPNSFPGGQIFSSCRMHSREVAPFSGGVKCVICPNRQEVYCCLQAERLSNRLGRASLYVPQLLLDRYFITAHAAAAVSHHQSLSSLPLCIIISSWVRKDAFYLGSQDDMKIYHVRGTAM